MSRRAFLGLTGGAAAVAVGGTAAWRSLVDDRVHDATDPTTTTATPGTSTSIDPDHAGRVLVVVQLGGGNDGLNTLVPAGDGRYYDRRPTLAVPEDQVVALPGLTGYGLNPALGPLAPYWAQGRLGLVEGIGFPGQSRSHFQALDTWWNASLDNTARTGWLGRWLDAVGDPSDPLRAIALGSGSPALVGQRAQSTVVLDPAGFALSTPDGVDADGLSRAFVGTAEPLSSDPVIAAAQGAVPGTLGSVRSLAPALTDQTSEGDDNEGGNLTTLLGVAARVIDLGLGTRIIVVSVSGFDTHANEGAAHPPLLTDLATGLDRFLQAVDAQGRADDVLVMTTSEFGRRVVENGSGTDHGKASVALLAGGPVAGGQVVGQADLGALDDGDLTVAIDTRSMYAAALDWLGGPTDDLLGGTYDRHGLLKV
ncbi:MAG: DUF1501 domain-containing protein [Acidimicrobiales bacterium]